MQEADKIKAKGIDEIWCVSVNDAFAMAAWGKDNDTGSKVRMIADGNAQYSEALGLSVDLTAKGMGIRSQRYSMIINDGVVEILNTEAPGKFETSSAGKMLEQL